MKTVEQLEKELNELKDEINQIKHKSFIRMDSMLDTIQRIVKFIEGGTK